MRASFPRFATPEPGCAATPTFHSGLLAVRFRRSARRFLWAAPHDPETQLPPETGPGMRSLHQLERAGLLRNVVPLAVPEAERTTARRRGALGRAALSVPEEAGDGPLAGACLVQVETEEETEWLRRRLAEDPDVEAVARVAIRHLLGPAVILAMKPPAPTLWNLVAIEAPAARALPHYCAGAEIKVAVLDTGVDEDHPDLERRVASYRCHYPHPVAPVALRPVDVVGHGTHVAGIISALAGDGYGASGISAAQIFAYKVFQDRAACLLRTGLGAPCFAYANDPLAYLLALGECLHQEVDVLNLSLGGPEPPDPIERALLDALLARGTTIVAAMGNGGLEGSPASYPAAAPGVIAVGASRLDDRIADFSSRGSHISLCAPGVAVWSTVPIYPGDLGHRAQPGPGGSLQRGAPIPRETDYDAWDGTSMAAAHVSGAVALLLANRGPLPPAEVKRRLEMTAGRVAGMNGLSFDPAYGHGRLCLRRLILEE